VPRNSRDKRPKASALHAGREFTRDFPSVEDIRVEVTEVGYGVPGDLKGPGQTSVHTPTDHHIGPFGQGTTSGFIDCSNPACYGGGFYVDSILHEMVQASEAERLVEVVGCIGYEGTRRSRYRDCLNVFAVKVSIHYKPPE